jgi:hypothetical protein
MIETTYYFFYSDHLYPKHLAVIYYFKFWAKFTEIFLCLETTHHLVHLRLNEHSYLFILQGECACHFCNSFLLNYFWHSIFVFTHFMNVFSKMLLDLLGECLDDSFVSLKFNANLLWIHSFLSFSLFASLYNLSFILSILSLLCLNFHVLKLFSLKETTAQACLD